MLCLQSAKIEGIFPYMITSWKDVYAPTTKGGTNLLFGQNLPKNYMKMKKIGLGGMYSTYYCVDLQLQWSV